MPSNRQRAAERERREAYYAYWWGNCTACGLRRDAHAPGYPCDYPRQTPGNPATPLPPHVCKVCGWHNPNDTHAVCCGLVVKPNTRKEGT